MKKILIIANYKKSVGGISGQVEILLKNFNSKNIKIDLFNTKTNNIKRLLLFPKLLLKGKNYDIFHIHGCSFMGFYPIVLGVFIGKILKKEIIITYHGGGLQKFMEQYEKIVKFFLLKADVITVPSLYLKNILDMYHINSVVLANIIREDNVYYKKREIIRPYLTVTRSLEPVYNISLVIDAFFEIKKVYKNSRLRIIGEGSLKEKLINKVKALGLSDVEFVGRVENSGIGKELNKSDIYINPSTKDSFSVSMFEAFACGLPVISTNVGGISNFVIDGENGFLINSNDINGLVKKIKFVLANQDKVKAIIENAYNTFQKYTFSNLKNKYLELYTRREI